MLNSPQAVKVVTTVSAEGALRSIRVGSLIAPAPNLVAVGAILMKTSAKNMESMKAKKQEVALLISSEMKSYLIMAKVKDVHRSGPLFDERNKNLKAVGMQAGEVWTFGPTGVWNESANYESGKKTA
ncbi:MAG: hypothetical protein LLG16_03625 [Euryarchaeota archaeon]|nr:hypothetical protein [Euryarchaeota archaeon]